MRRPSEKPCEFRGFLRGTVPGGGMGQSTIADCSNRMRTNKAKRDAPVVLVAGGRSREPRHQAM